MQTEPQPAVTSASATSSAPNPQPASPEPNHTPRPTIALDQNNAPSARQGLDQLLNPSPALSLVAVASSQPATVVNATPVPATLPQHRARRRGRIACLPKPHRDLVNRMLANGVPYKNIVAALHEADFTVTERNISSWATGGYLEWRLEQDAVTQNRLDQDHLVDHLRTDDASQLPEVGLQAAATRLSQILLQKIARGDDVEKNLGTFDQMVDILCRLNREIGLLQKQRDDARRTLGRHHDPVRISNEEQRSVLELERDFSYPDDPESGLENPPTEPFLPPYPTSSALESKDLEAKHRDKMDHYASVRVMLQALKAKKTPASTDLQPLPPSEPSDRNGQPHGRLQ